MDADAYEAGIVEAYEAELRKKDTEIQSYKEDRNRFTVILREKDAEIDRLKGENAQLNENYVLSLEANQERREKIEAQQNLITELCDVLDRCDPIQISIQEVAVLIQRAREATR